MYHWTTVLQLQTTWEMKVIQRIKHFKRVQYSESETFSHNIPCSSGLWEIPQNLLPENKFFSQHHFLHVSDHLYRQSLLISKRIAMLNIKSARA